MSATVSAARVGCALLLAVGATRVNESRADEIGMYALAGGYETNNPERVSSGGRHDTVGYLTLSNYGAWETGRLIAHWTVSESGTTYLHSKLGSKTYGDATIRTQYDIMPRFLSWRLNDDYGQMLVNPNEADTPLNRANYNVFSTGPKLRVPLSMRTWLESSALYTHSYYQSNPLGGDTKDVELGINRALTRQVTLAMYAGQSSGSTEQFGSFDTQRASLRMMASGAWTKLVANAGLNRALRPVHTGNLPFYELDVQRKLPTGSQLEIQVSRVLTNLAQEFGRISSTTPISSGVNSVLGTAPGNAVDLNTSADLFDATTVRASFYTKHRRTEWQGGVSWRKEDPLEGHVGDRRRYAAVDLSYYRIWGSKTGIRFYGAYGITRGEQHADQYDHQSVIGCEFAKPLGGPGLRWVATLERSTRNSNFNGAQYSEIRLGFYLRYSKFIYQKE